MVVDALTVIKNKVYHILGIKKEETRAAETVKRGKYSEYLLKNYGIDIDLMKSETKESINNMVLFGFFNPNKFTMNFNESTELREPTKLDKLRRDFAIWRREKIFELYGYYKSDDT